MTGAPRVRALAAVGPVIQSIWQALVGTVEVYEEAVIFATISDEYEIDPADDMDGDRISAESLAFELIECVREVIVLFW